MFLQTSLKLKASASNTFCKKKYNITKGGCHEEQRRREEFGISRRNFLRTSAAVGVAVTLSGLPAIAAETKSEKTASAPFKQGMVNTALGPISPDKLGTTLMHEHFAFGYPGWYADDTIAPYDYEDLMKINLKNIKMIQGYGIKTIVDATPNDCGGRNPEMYKALAKKTGFNIICSTGLYTNSEGAPGPIRVTRAWTGQDIPKMMSELFIREITQGIGKKRYEGWSPQSRHQSQNDPP